MIFSRYPALSIHTPKPGQSHSEPRQQRYKETVGKGFDFGRGLVKKIYESEWGMAPRTEEERKERAKAADTPQLWAKMIGEAMAEKEAGATTGSIKQRLYHWLEHDPPAFVSLTLLNLLQLNPAKFGKA